MLEQDLPRLALGYGVALNFNPHFPINTRSLMRGVFAAPTLFLGKHRYFGQDRLDLIEDILRA